MKHLTILLSLILATTLSAWGQSPVKWRANARLTSPDKGVITVKATVAPGWHLYSTSLPTGGPKPTVIDLSKSVGVKIDGKLKPSKAPMEKMDKNFGIKLGYWEETVTFTVPFTLTAPCDKARVAASVSYMACDDTTCMPPQKTELTSAVLPIKNSAKK